MNYEMKRSRGNKRSLTSYSSPAIPLFITTFLTICCLYWKPVFSAPINVQIELAEPWGFYLSGQTKSPTESRISGIWVDIINLLSRETGVKFNTTLAPHARVVQNLAHGKIDLSFLIKSEMENEDVECISYLFSIHTIVVSPVQQDIRSYDDLYGKRIGIVRGIKLDPKFDSDGSLFKQAYRNYSIIVTMLAQNRLDAIVGDSISIPYLMKNQRLNLLLYQSFVLRKSPVWIQLSGKSSHQSEKEAIIRASDRLRNQGYFNNILTKYAGYQVN